MFPEAKPRETLSFEGTPRDQSLSIYYYAISKQFLYSVFATFSMIALL